MRGHMRGICGPYAEFWAFWGVHMRTCLRGRRTRLGSSLDILGPKNLIFGWTAPDSPYTSFSENPHMGGPYADVHMRVITYFGPQWSFWGGIVPFCLDLTPKKRARKWLGKFWGRNTA